jgi:ABC-type ATPase involved in cell division
MGNVQPDKGKITIGGYDTKHRRERSRLARRLLVGIVSARIPLIDNRSVLENVSLPLELRGRSFGKTVRSAMNALHALGIVNIRRHIPAELSADERYLVSVARAIVSLPRVVIVDECDRDSGRATIADHPDLLRTMSAWGASVLIASHHIIEFKDMGLRRVTLEDGTITTTERIRGEGCLTSRSYLMDLLLKNRPSA